MKKIFILFFLGVIVIGGISFYFMNYDLTASTDEKEFKVEDSKVLVRQLGSQEAFKERNPKWGQPIFGKPGLKNFFRIDNNIYRGEQPTVEGFKELKKMNVKTIINLRSGHSDEDEIEKAGVKFNYQNISFKAWHAEDEDVIKFLKIINDKDNYPIFFHCQHGADRTGTMCAIYRMAVQGWSREEAIEEMTTGGYNFHSTWQNLIKYLKKVDIDKLKKEADWKEFEKETANENKEEARVIKYLDFVTYTDEYYKKELKRTLRKLAMLEKESPNKNNESLNEEEKNRLYKAMEKAEEEARKQLEMWEKNRKENDYEVEVIIKSKK